MSNMLNTIVPKSDQLNSDDLIGGPRTITITRVTVGTNGPADQPVSIYFQGDDGKPFKPCKSMRRVLVQIWGADANLYVGRSLTVYRDEKVQWAGQAVGGIRISHMSHLDAPRSMALTATKGKRNAYTVHPLAATPTKTQQSKPPTNNDLAARYAACRDAATFDALELERKAVWSTANAATKAALKQASDDAAVRLQGNDSQSTGELFDGDDPTLNH